MTLKYLIIKIKYILKLRNMNVIIDEFRKCGISIGKNCNIYSNIITSEPYLIKIGDNVTISNDVQIITHDNSICKVIPEFTDIFGEVKIGDNCFIGAKALILPGVTIPNNSIVAAGSVVSKSFLEEGCIIAGNPARIISNISYYKEKNFKYGVNIYGMNTEEVKHYLMSNPTKIMKK